MRIPASWFWHGLAALLLAAPAHAADWASWRGPTDNGVAPDKDLPTKFDVEQAGKDNLIWKAPYGCRSTPIVMNGRVYFNGHTGVGVNEKEREMEQERVVCLDADTGKKLWEYKYNVFLTDIVSIRVGWTHMVGDPATGNVYCHGAQGLLICFDKDGKILWQRSLAEEFGRVSGYGGRLGSPIVDGDLVIIGMPCAAWGKYGRGGARFVAFNKKSGALTWWASTGYRVRDTDQATPVVANINGQRLLISGAGDGGIHAFQVNTGKKVWTHLFSEGAINCKPLVVGNLVYVAHGDNNPAPVTRQGRVICLDASAVKEGKPKLVWQVDGPKIKFSSPVLAGENVIFNDEDGRLHCLDAKSGKTVWKFKAGGGSNVRNSPVLAGNYIYIGDGRAHLNVVDISGEKPKKVLSLEVPSLKPGVDAEMDGAASVSNGRLYFATNDQMFCVGKGEKTSVKAPEEARAPKAPADAKPAQLVVYPGEVTLSPGGKTTFKASLYDDHGRFLRETKAEWSVAPMEMPEETVGLPPVPKASPPALKGTITSDGTLALADMAAGQFGRVVAKAEGIEGSGRVLQTPKLPYKVNFAPIPEKAIPGGWVNTQGKFAVRQVGESKVLVKLAYNPSPLFARANAFMGPPTWSNYTVEADVMSKKVGAEMSDVGVVANRYSFTLWGNKQQLRLQTWEALPRIDKAIVYNWKPESWYHLKLQVETRGEKALVRGKIWEKGKEEPKEWTLEVEDPIGNLEGSPALYAYVSGTTAESIGAEVFYDNVSVVPNKANQPGGQANRKAPAKP